MSADTFNDVNQIIDSGAKGMDFDEQITFIHTYGKYRLFKNIKAIAEFPLMINYEFILVGSNNFDVDMISKMDNNEILQMIKGKVQSYHSDGDTNTKSSFIDNIAFYAKEIGFENTVDLLLPLIKKIKNENDTIKDSCKGYTIIRDQILPLISSFFYYKAAKIVDLAVEAFIEITNFIREEDKGEHLLNRVILLANEEDEECRVISAKLFNALAPNINIELCEIYAVPTIASFAEDTNSKVRKAVALNFMNMCKSISEDTFKRKMLPVYDKLSHDSLWIVRKTATSLIPQISEIIKEEKDKEILLDIYKSFISDLQKFVRQSAIDVIGQFLNTLPKHLRKQFILDFYIKTITDFYSNTNEISTQADNEALYNCAYNFPAILLLYGSEKWKDLKNCYIRMSNDRYFKVRKTLASSINEVAKIIGKEETESCLIPIFDRFYREEGEIQKSIYKSMPEFLLNIKEEKRKDYLDKFRRLLRTKEKWRTKKEYVQILGNLGGVFDDSLTFEQILPVCLNMCFDEVYEVRIHASKSIKSLIKHFLTVEEGFNEDTINSEDKADTPYRNKTKAILKAFAMSTKYIYRMLFLYLSMEMINEEEIFKKYFLPYLVMLSNDKIINVQILFAELLIKIYKHNYCNDNPEFKKMLVRSIYNTNPSVKEQFINLKDDEYIKSLQNEDIEAIKNAKYSNIYFDNKMEIFKEFNIMSACITTNNLRNKYINKEDDNHKGANNDNNNNNKKLSSFDLTDSESDNNKSDCESINNSFEDQTSKNNKIENEDVLPENSKTDEIINNDTTVNSTVSDSK